MDENTQLPDPSQIPIQEGFVDPWVGQMLSGYHLIKRVGEGGMGIVYMARHQSLDRLAAVKFLGAHMIGDPAYIQRFFQEARAAATLNHPNLVSVYDAGRVGENVYYIIMEYVEGTNLRALVNQRGKLLVSEAVDYIRQAAMGLGYAHKKGIVHRDVKPDNLMLTTDGAIKIGDLGLAKWSGNQDGSMTGTGAVLGTPYYISPEQIRGSRDVDGRTDIYSLGGTFFHLLTGKIPYEGSSPAVIMAMHLNDPVPDPRKVRPPLDKDLCDILARMMAKRPEDRYASMEELEKALTDYKSRPTYTAVDVSVPVASTPAPAAKSPSSDYWKAALFGCVGLIVGMVLIAVLAFVMTRHQPRAAGEQASEVEAAPEPEAPAEPEEPPEAETAAAPEEPAAEEEAAEEPPAAEEAPAPSSAPVKPVVEYAFTGASAHSLPEGVQCFISELNRRNTKVGPSGITLLRGRSSWILEREGSSGFLSLRTESPARLKSYLFGASFYVPLLPKGRDYEITLKLRSQGEPLLVGVVIEPGEKVIEKVTAETDWTTTTLSIPSTISEGSHRIVVGFKGAGRLDIAEVKVQAEP
jgi:serine/threonine-protein kinase